MIIQPYSTSRHTRPGHSKKNGSTHRERTITRKFLCLSDKDRDRVPTTVEKLRLKSSGLGEKKILLPVDANAEAVKAILYEAFSPLKHCGGFELLTVKERSRTELNVVSYGSSSTDEIRCFGTGRIYIRPVETDIALNESVDWGEQYEDCMTCNMPIALSEMRQHLEECGTEFIAIEDDNDNLPPMLEAVGEHDVQRSSTSTNTSTSSSTAETIHLDDSEMNNVENGIAEAVYLEDSSTDKANNDGDNEEPVESHTEPDKEKDLIPFELHRQKAIEDTLTSMLTCSEPVTVLKEYRDNFMRGRPLDVEREDTPCEGKVIEIFVSRMNILKDAMAELLTDPPIPDLSFPLDVTFIGEEAADYGGPRKEFLGAVMRELRDQLFDEAGSEEYILTNDVTSLRQNYYFVAGLIFGFSMLQGGPLPCFLKEEQLQRLLVGEYSILKESEKQFKCGLEKFGLIELVNRKPCLIFLLRKTAVRPLMYPRLVKLLKARFSEEGSNSRAEEEKTYRTFINYLKEVSAGRRPSVTLEKVLKFVTGSEAEPVLGYGINPHIAFDRFAKSCLPTSNTCVNKLTLPVGDMVPQNPAEIYAFFDYAFSNDFFGNI